MYANYISLDLTEKFKEREIIEGHINTVFSTLFTIITDCGELIYFLNNKKYIAPMSIVLEDLGSFKDFNLSQDTRIVFKDEHIMIDAHRIEIDMRDVKMWNPNVELLSKQSSKETINNNLLILEEAVYKHGKYEGFAPLLFSVGDYIDEMKSFSNLNIHNNLYSSFISSRIIEFIYDIVNGNLDDIGKTVSQFIEYGPGITPSSNDFLCGLMISLLYLGQHYNMDIKKVYDFNETLLSEIDLDRKEMSHDLLYHYSRGRSQKMIKNLMNSLIYDDNEVEVCKSIRETISFGDISGTDMVCGVYFGIRIINNEIFKSKLV